MRFFTCSYFVRILSVAAAIGLFLMVFSSMAQAGLLLNPTRVILDNRNNSAKVSVINQSDEPARYRVSLVLYRYRSDGGMEEITHPGEEESQILRLVRFSPRQTDVPARGRQTIRLQFRKRSGLDAGEYRVHLKVVPVPPAAPGPGAGSGQEDKDVRINLLVGISIPIVIRNGDLWVKAKTVSCRKIISARTGRPALELDIEREGTRSVIMDLKAYHVSRATDGGGTLIGESHDAVIYPQFNSKTFELPVDEELIDRIRKGSIRIEISDSEKPSRRGNADALLGTAVFDSSEVFSR